ncbi:ArtI protein [Advenella sp. S44]|uniref:transporter substrate-binding domain-containing protein n=1 Tax=Advenella sp. S44 TaxID=1982755 RepID=UPI000C2AFD90|nr:transporter substrate-binding domain-containing protein [Advenella sp. S44]PJX25462.1 ArtI protein [Advenella sp. S44]
MKKTLLAALLCTFPLSLLAQTAPNTLKQVTDSKVLRVCTPGDYKPFSFDKDGHFEGLDIDLMNALAESLGAKMNIVKTSWSNLMSDFTSDKCDIGAGGISVSTERQRQAFFSAPYMVNGKTPIVRCEDKEKYQSIEALNRAEVKIVANPGGSNEKFARTMLPNASLTMHKDNLTIFDEVANGSADAFVTEAAEARVQSKLNPKLCAVNPEQPLQYAEMGYLIPDNDIRFKLYVDQWMHLLKASGQYDQMAEKWIPADPAK